mgnify:FL=1
MVVPDATRKAELPTVLPVLLDRLPSASRATVLIACGTHPPAPQPLLRTLVGEVPAGVEVVQHDARDEEALEIVGELAPGVPLRMDRAVVDADLVVTLGPVGHHYFAGFGGGPKLLFPGVARYAEIQANHARVLSREGDEWRRHPACEPGQIDGNPVAEEIRRAASMHPAGMAVAIVAGSDGRPAWAAAGSQEDVQEAAIERVRAWYELPNEEPFPLVVVSGGGAPADRTLIQAHKALDAAFRFARPGAEVLFVASLRDGAGSQEMEPFLDDPRPGVILQRLADRWVQYGHTTLRLVEKTRAATVFLVSDLEPHLARRLGFVPVADPAQVVERWRSRGRESVGVVTGPPVYPARM